MDSAPPESVSAAAAVAAHSRVRVPVPAMGQQSNSGKARTKRDGIPNNPKIRKQLLKVAADKKEGMTYAKRKAMREAAKPKTPSAAFGKQGMVLKAAPKGPLEVRYRALAKRANALVMSNWFDGACAEKALAHARHARARARARPSADACVS